MVTLIDTAYDIAAQIVPENVGKFTEEAEKLLNEDPKKVSFSPFAFFPVFPGTDTPLRSSPIVTATISLPGTLAAQI